jgi:4-diphosphocytidyl-2-C-methyl-D-erythritol kinase
MKNSRFTFLAPAKINLCLHVLGRFANGYHDLAMLMQRVSLYDEIRLQLTADGNIAFSCTDPTLEAAGDNLVLRAARSLFEYVGADLGVTIVLDKRIPIAAGLGGGSSDAAAILLGLNQVAGFGLDKPELMNLGVKLGADVPFFILEQSAWATGIGDELDPVVDLPSFHYVLVNPGVPVSTAWVYQNLRLTSPVEVAKLRKFPRTPEGLVRLLHNDLEQVTIARFPLIAEVKQALCERGALGALMSGSGATVFGLYADLEQAQQVATGLTGDFGWWAEAVSPLV